MTRADKLFHQYERLARRRRKIMFKIRDKIAAYVCEHIEQYLQADSFDGPILLSDLMEEAHFVVFQAMCGKAFDSTPIQAESELVSLINERLRTTHVLKVRVTEHGDMFAPSPRIWVKPF